MTKSELISALAEHQPSFTLKQVERGVRALLEHMVQALAGGRRIEVRGFGSFSLHHRQARVGRNPRTGESVDLPSKYVPHFKAGKVMRERANYKKPPKPVGKGRRSAKAKLADAPVKELPLESAKKVAAVAAEIKKAPAAKKAAATPRSAKK